MVDTIRYTNAEHTEIEVEPENMLLSKPFPPHRQTMIDDWIALGNEIQVYNRYINLSEEEAFINKEIEIDIYAYSLIEGAYTNPIDAVIVDPNRYKIKLDRRRKSNADKLAGEIALTQTEKDEAKTDQKLSEYELKISNDQDKAIDNLHKLTGVDSIMSFNVVNESWNIWVPPV